VNAAKTSPPGFTLQVSPSGVPRALPAAADEEVLTGQSASALASAFEAGAGYGVLHLGAVEVGTALPPAFAHFRELGHELVARACAHPELEALRDRIRIEPALDRLEPMTRAVPPLRGAEYVTTESLAMVWTLAADALRAELAAWRGPVSRWLHAKNAAWATVGRVCFHLAENKRDPDVPFAFLATYTTRLSTKGAPQHRPLGHALVESRASLDRERLLALLLPVQRAADKSALVRDMIERGDLYRPLRWTAREAFTFLKEIPALEAAGVVVRVPDWWNARVPPRPQVRVTVGGRPPSRLGTEALLDFSVDVVLDGEPLSAEERQTLLRATDGLVLIKGRWVEADGARLRDVLAHWKGVEQSAKRRVGHRGGCRAEPDRAAQRRADSSRDP
jgi:hypothetical protein